MARAGGSARRPRARPPRPWAAARASPTARGCLVSTRVVRPSWQMTLGPFRAPPLTGGRPLRVDVDRVQRLARHHEEAVALGAAEAEVAAGLGQPDAADELAFGRPDRHAAIAAPTPAGIAVARDPRSEEHTSELQSRE